MHTQTPPPALRFRAAQFRRYGAARGIVTDTEIARATGLDRSTVNRLLSGTAPGVRAIAAFLAAFPDRHFEDFFEVAAGTSARTAA
jgi:transcriptional regulator with XRE-family HTH domain